MKIMLDAGHGYETAGKRTPDGMREYEFTRAVAIFAKEMLSKYENTQVYFSHSDTRDVPLRERTDMAKKLGVDIIVSIHANAYGSTWNSSNGIETFVDTTKPKIALQLAEKVQDNLIKLTGLSNRGVKTGDLHMVREPRIVGINAILVECGFMTNHKEAELLKSDSYRKTCAKAIVNGLVVQYGLKLIVVKPVVIPVVKEEVKIEGGRKMNLTTAQMNLLVGVYEQALAKGIITSETWVEKAKAGTLTVDEAIMLNAVIMGRTVLK